MKINFKMPCEDRGRKRSPKQAINSQPATSSSNCFYLVNDIPQESNPGRNYLPQLQIPKSVLQNIPINVEIRITFKNISIPNSSSMPNSKRSFETDSCL